MPNFFTRLRARFSNSSTPKVISYDDLPTAAMFGQWAESVFDGEKFAGGFGLTELQVTDYWTLRQRSAQLFNENLYARGLIRRLVTNEINTGLSPEASPDEKIIGVAEDSLDEWAESVENRFALWGKCATLCDWRQSNTFGALQRAARMEALVTGDVLVILRQSPITKLPMVQLVEGNRVCSPLFTGTSNLAAGHTIRHGVELDEAGRIVAYWVKSDDEKDFERVDAYGPKTGRLMAWLVFGTDKRFDSVRGQPILSLVLQSLKEIDRYRDSAQRKAVINSILAMYIKKTQDKVGSLPLTGGAVRKDKVDVTDGDGKQRQFKLAAQIPGLVVEELQQGEEPVGFHSQGIDVNFGLFEESIICAVAWANEIPPEILRLAFSNNYSASQAAINEFKIYLNLIWSNWGETFCTPIYIDWLLSEVLLQKIPAPGFLESWRDPAKYDIFGAWVCVEWYGSIKPSTDTLKQARGSALLVQNGWSTNAREARITTGTKFSKNVKRLRRENEQLAEALRPLLEIKKEFADVLPADEGATVAAKLDEVLEFVQEPTTGAA